HLAPRSRLDVGWTSEAGVGARNLPLLTAQGEIAIDIDAEQMRTRSSWNIGCVRGIAESLQLRIDDDDEVTELQLADQSTVPTEQARAGGNLTIRLSDPLRPRTERRLVMKTRRFMSGRAPGRIAFSGFPLAHAREQSGAIGITQSPNLWVSATASRG